MAKSLPGARYEEIRDTWEAASSKDRLTMREELEDMQTNRDEYPGVDADLISKIGKLRVLIDESAPFADRQSAFGLVSDTESNADTADNPES